MTPIRSLSNIPPTFKVYGEHKKLLSHIRTAFLQEREVSNIEWNTKLISAYSESTKQYEWYSLVYESPLEFIAGLSYMISFQTYYNGKHYAVVKPCLNHQKSDKYNKLNEGRVRL
jgi:hypothetical protein